MSKLKRSGTRWLSGYKIPSRKKYKTSRSWLDRFYELNKSKIDPNLYGQAPKKKQFLEAVNSAKKDRHLKWQLDTDRVSTKQALEQVVRNLFTSEEELYQKNIREILRTTGYEKKVRDVLGVKSILTKNISWNRDDKVFEYSVSEADGKERKVRISVDSYNKSGFKHIDVW